MTFAQQAREAAEKAAVARNEATAARVALFEAAPAPEGASQAEQRAAFDRATELRAAAGKAERAAAVAESEATNAQERANDAAPAGGFTRADDLLRGAPSEVREFHEIVGRARLGRVIQAAMRGDSINDGAEAELRQHSGLPFDTVPFELLDPGYRAAEKDGLQLRVDATSAGLSSVATIQEAIIQRVFAAASCMSVLGCRVISQPVEGDCLIPVITAGQTPAFTAKAGRVDAAAGTIEAFVREPKRLSGAWRFAVEDEARIMGFEPALRRDLSRSMSDSLDKTILGLGDAQVRGLLATNTNGGIADLTAASNTVTYALALAEFGRAVDGLHAESTKQCSLLVRPEVYNKLLELMNTGSGQLATQTAMDLFGMFRASANLPAPSNANVSTGIIARRGQGDMMNSFIPVWRSRGVKLIRDEITRAAEGEVRITATAFSITRWHVRRVSRVHPGRRHSDFGGRGGGVRAVVYTSLLRRRARPPDLSFL